MRDEQTNKRTLKIELLSQWKLEAESRNCHSGFPNGMKEDKSPLRTNHSNCLTEIATIQASPERLC